MPPIPKPPKKKTQLKKQPKKKIDCIACGGTGVASKGGCCAPCSIRKESKNA